LLSRSVAQWRLCRVAGHYRKIDVWFGVLAPAGTPRPIVDRLNAEINRVLQDPQVVKDRLNSVGLSPVGTTPERYMEVMKADLVKYAKITRDAGIKPDL
jgi:tripartite-type tricarboxylate transporter receptor subunit TctC